MTGQCVLGDGDVIVRPVKNMHMIGRIPDLPALAHLPDDRDTRLRNDVNSHPAGGACSSGWAEGRGCRYSSLLEDPLRHIGLVL